MYKIVLIKNDFTAEVEEEKITHKFIKPQVLMNLKKFKLKNYNNVFIYTFTKNVSFLVIKEIDNNNNTDINQYILKKYQGVTLNLINEITYKCYHNNNQNESITNISQALRSSNTLKETEYNSFVMDHTKLILDEKGFYLLNTDSNRFERCVLMFILALSYNHYNMMLTNNLSHLYQTKKLRKMIKTRDDYLRYNMFTYSSNPVKNYRHESFAIWDKMSMYYHVHKTHNEIKSQVTDLISVIQNKVEVRLSYWFSFIGIGIAILSCIAAFK